jgi:hypothetical protein
VTQTARPRTTVRRPGAIYGLDIADHDTLMTTDVHKVVKDDYVGQTRQKGRARESQHRDDKPYEDLIVGSAHVLEQGMWTDEELDEREVYWIRRLRPRMNYEHNLDNPHRIEIWRQKEQRWVRDDAASRPRWVPLERRRASSLLDQSATVRYGSTQIMPERRLSAPRSWTAGQRRARRGVSLRAIAASWAAAWLMIASMTLGFVIQSSIGDVGQRAWTVGLVPTAFVAFGYWLGPQAWKAFKRSIRRRIRDIF